jgi:predicted Zn-dependent peptidase
MNSLERIQPPVFPVSKVTIPDAKSFILQNGVPVYMIDAGTEPIMRIEFTFRAGQAKEDIPLLASSVNMMLTEGSASYTSEELNRLIDYYGAFINSYNEKDSAGVIMFFLNKHIEKVLELCREILFMPAFPENELNALLRKRQRWYLVNKEKVQNRSIDQFFESIFGSRHPYGRQIREEDFTGLDSSLLKEFHTRYYSPGNMAVIVSGKLHKRTAELLDHFFGGIAASPADITDNNEKPAGEKEKKVHIEKNGSVQTAIRIGSATINKRHPDYPGLKVLDSLLGGYFGSRLMRNIREDKGFTYGIGSALTSLNLSGYKIISAEVAPKNLQKTIDEIYKEIRQLQEVPTGETELSVVRNYMSGEMVRMFDGPFALAESFRSAWEFGLDNNYYHRLWEKIMKIAPDEIMSLANTYYNTDELYQITVGSK